MFRHRITVLAVFVLIFFAASGLLFGIDGKAVLDDNSVGFLFLNVGKVYNLAISQLKKIDAPESAATKMALNQMWTVASQNFMKARENARGKACSANMRVLLGAVEMYNMDNKEMMANLEIPLLVKNKYLLSEPNCPDGGKYGNQGELTGKGKIACSIHQTVEDFSAKSAQGAGEKGAPQFGEVIAKILDFDSKGYFRPTGGLWLSFNQNMLPKIVLEASAKPKEFHEILSAIDSNGPKPSKIEANLVVFDLPPAGKIKEPMKLEIRTDGLVIGSVPSESAPPESWKDALKFVQSADCSAVIEVDGKKVVEILKKETVEGRIPKAPNADPDFPLPDPRLKSFKRLRLWAGGTRIILLAAFDDPKFRAELKQKLAEGFEQVRGQAKTALSNLPDQQMAANLKALLDKVAYTEKDEWLGYSLEGVDDPTMITSGVAITGILAAIAVPNFKKARDTARQKSCYANQRVLWGACEMYEMDKGKPIETLDMDILVKGDYLKSPPVCPDQGVYAILRGEKNLPIRCSFHGRIPLN